MKSVVEQLTILMRGVDFGDAQTYANMEKELRARLQESYDSGRPLRVYCGYDPSSPDLHLGHTISMRKLRQFQDLGHDVTFLIGTFTGIIGDPSDKESARPPADAGRSHGEGQSLRRPGLPRARPQQARGPLQPRVAEQARLSPTSSAWPATSPCSSSWRATTSPTRFERGDAIWLHEFFYALMQGYDAVAQQTDVQIGGTDQLFNLMAGRKLMEAHGLQPQIVLTFPILEAPTASCA